MYTNFRCVPIIKFKDYYSILFPHVAMYVWTERNKGFVSCSDFVGYGNSLSNIFTFILSYTELITLTALELTIGFLEGFFLSAFLSIGNDSIQNTAYIGSFRCHTAPYKSKICFLSRCSASFSSSLY